MARSIDANTTFTSMKNIRKSSGTPIMLKKLAAESNKNSQKFTWIILYDSENIDLLVRCGVYNEKR